MVKTYGIFILICITLGYLCFNLIRTVQGLKEENKRLTVALENNLQAAKDKENRSKNELEQLRTRLQSLHDINTVCLNSPVDPVVISWLQELQQKYSGTLSITFTE